MQENGPLKEASTVWRGGLHQGSVRTRSSDLPGNEGRVIGGESEPIKIRGG